MRWIGGGLAVVAVAALIGALGWALYATGALDFSPGSGAIVAIIAAGVLLVGALAGVLMWLAFYSSSKGYDEALRFGVAPDEAGPGPGTDRQPKAPAASSRS